MLINAHKSQVHMEGGVLVDQSQRLRLDFWRGARQIRRRLRRRPVRLCVGYGVGSTQKYKLAFTSNECLVWLIIIIIINNNNNNNKRLYNKTVQ